MAVERITMARGKLLLLASAALGLAQLTLAQAPPLTPVCASSLQSSMACVIPQVYGTTGLTLNNPTHKAHFDADFANLVVPVTVSVGTELALRSIASPASGVLFTFDKTLGTVTRSSESYGPILTERAETVGRHRVFVATTYEFRDFSSLDGISLKHLPLTLSHVQFPAGALTGADVIPCPKSATGFCPVYAEDYISTQNRIDLKAHEFTLYGTYGLTDRVDLSVAIPILDVRLGITSTAHIARIAPQPVSPTDALLYASTDGTGYFHFFDVTNAAGSTDALFSNHKSASGIGDVVFRVKGTAWKGERARLALGLDFRAATGDAKNFLGSGAPGIKPFLAASYRGRISPHFNLGFEYNGKSVLAGNVQTNAIGKLPNEFFYSGGVDAGVTKKLTVAADMLGTRLSSAQRFRSVPFVDAVDGIAYPNVPQAAGYRDAVNTIDFSIGAKYSPFGNFLVTGNVVIKANNAGLRANYVPLIGASYSF
jgi:hypothetical protein